MRSLTLVVHGLSCGKCVAAVEDSLSALPCLSTIDIVLHNLPNRGSTLTVSLAEDAPADDAVLASVRNALSANFSADTVRPTVERDTQPLAPTRSISLPVLGLSCPACVASIENALSSLSFLSHVVVNLYDVPGRVSTLSAQLTSDAPADDEVIATVRAALPVKFTVLSSRTPGEDIDVIKPGTASTRDVPLVARRFRCGCSTLSCVCSRVPVVPGDTGVLVRVSSDDTSDSPACCCAAEGATCCVAASASPVQKHVALSVSGMTCASCVSKVEAFLRTQPGVTSASVSLLTARAALQVDPTVFDADAAVTRLKDIGYEATQINEAVGQKDDVFLRFLDLVTAQKAVEILRASPHVNNAEICHPIADSVYSKTSSALRRFRSCCRGRKQGKHQHGIMDTKGSAIASCAENLRSRATRGKAAMPVVKLTSERKLAAVKTLDEADWARRGLSYEVLSRNDPQLTGGLETTDVLQREARHLFFLFLGALLCTVPVALCTMLFARVDALGAETLTKLVGNSGFRVVDIISFILATPVQFVFGFRFYRGSWFALKRFRANMDVLVALGTSIAYFFSVIILILNTIQIRNGVEVTEDPVAFETSSLLITIVLFGKWLEAVAKKKTAAGVEALAKLAPRHVTLVSEPPVLEPLSDAPAHVELVSVGDYFQVNPGAAFPLDGAVEVGQTIVDESMLTGESWPVSKEPGDAVYAGTVNGGKAVIVRCTTTDADSMLEKIITLVKRAQESRAPIEAFADRVSSVFVPVVLLIALVVVTIWFTLAQTGAIPESWSEGEGNVFFSLLFGLSVLVIACPCALGLATPTVIMVATSIGARRLGILYKDGGEALQAANAVEVVLFDKTGTLTIGNPVVTCTAVFGTSTHEEISPETKSGKVIRGELLRTVAAAESYSDHPLARAIVAYSEAHTSRGKEPIDVSDHEAILGKGIRCSLENGGEIKVGEYAWVLSDTDNGATLPVSAKAILDRWEAYGRTVVLACVPDEPLVGFGIEDPVRYESVAVVSHLKRQGITCGMVTGDSLGTARAVARIVGINEDNIHARALPADKVKAVQGFAHGTKEDTDVEGRKDAKGVVFVGDGINDAGALAAASVGIAMGSGAQIAAENAGIVLVKSNLWDVVTALDLAHKAFGRIKINYVWALGFNCLAIPLAGGALYPVLEKRIPPFAAAAAMGLSSITVVLSSMSLGLYKSPTPNK